MTTKIMVTPEVIEKSYDLINTLIVELTKQKALLNDHKNEYELAEAKFIIEGQSEMKEAGCTNEKSRNAYIKNKFEDEIKKIQDLHKDVEHTTMQLTLAKNNLKCYLQIWEMEHENPTH